jgi:hypothetical protein
MLVENVLVLRRKLLRAVKFNENEGYVIVGLVGELNITMIHFLSIRGNEGIFCSLMIVEEYSAK